MTSAQPLPDNDPGLVLERTFAAPRAQVWKAWTDAELQKQWWGPRGFDAPFMSLDLRVGGKWLLCMRGLEGEFAGWEGWCTGTYLELEPERRLVTTDCFSDKEGNIVEPETYGMQGWPRECLVTVELSDAPDGGTHMRVHQGVPLELAKRFKCDDGWNQSFDKLAEQLAG